jgi:hypothetical protein
MTQRAHRQSVPLPWRWFAAAAAAGIPVGLLWWLLAPGGLNLITRDPALGNGENPVVWLPRDLTLAGLFVFAGCVVAVLIMDKPRSSPRLVLALGLAGGLAGAVIAWQAGVFAGQLWGAPADTSANASVAFSLRSMAVLVVWPAATAISVFVISLLNELRRAPDRTGSDSDGAPLAGSAAPNA